MGDVPEYQGPLPPAWGVIEFTFSDRDTDSELVIECNRRHFVILLSESNFSSSTDLQKRYLFFLEVAENFELDGYTVEDFYDWVAEPLLPIFRLTPDSHAWSTLDDFVHPECHVYTVKAVGERLAAIPCNDKGITSSVFGVYFPDDICARWPSFKPQEIHICEESSMDRPPSTTPAKVLLPDGTVAFLKLMRPGCQDSHLREIEGYGKIHDAGLHKSLRIPSLYGLVRDEDGQLFGLLLTYIHCGWKTLHCAVKPEAHPDLRQQWATQVRHIVQQLHGAGIVWGDAKPDNILVDHDNDAWVIDFGGGYTDGWVPEELAGSLEGDLLALEKIDEFINK